MRSLAIKIKTVLLGCMLAGLSHAYGVSDEKQLAIKLSEKIFLSSTEFCDRAASNPSVKAYARIFEKINTEVPAIALFNQNASYYTSVLSRYLDPDGLLKGWVSEQIKSEGIDKYIEYRLSAIVIQMANECARQHYAEPLFFFFDPAGASRKAISRQADMESKRMLDSNGNLTTNTSFTQPASVYLPNFGGVGDAYLRNLMIAADTPLVVSYWALALRNGENAIKNASQEKLESELVKLDQWTAELQETEEKEKQAAELAKKKADQAAAQEKALDDARLEKEYEYRNSRDLAYSILKYSMIVVLILTIISAWVGGSSRGVFYWDNRDVFSSTKLSLVIGAGLMFLVGIYNEPDLSPAVRVLGALIALLCIGAVYVISYKKARQHNSPPMAALISVGRLMLPIFLISAAILARSSGKNMGYSGQATNETDVEYRARLRRLDQENKDKKAQSAIIVAIILSFSTYLYMKLVAKKEWEAL